MGELTEDNWLLHQVCVDCLQCHLFSSDEVGTPSWYHVWNLCSPFRQMGEGRELTLCLLFLICFQLNDPHARMAYFGAAYSEPL